MYQVCNPYTGDDNRSVNNSLHDWALRGLGMGDTTAAGLPVDTVHNSGGGGTVMRVPSDFASRVRAWAQAHPQGAQFYGNHPRLKRRALRHSYNEQGNNPPAVGMPALSGLGASPSSTDAEYDPGIYTGDTSYDGYDSGSSFDWTSIIKPLTDAGLTAEKLLLTPGGSYTSMNPKTGQLITYQGTGQPTTSVNIPGLTTLGGGGGISMTMLLVAGAGLVLLLMASKK